MLFICKILLFLYTFITTINCKALCNKLTNLAPETEYHCSGLEIDKYTKPDDKYCCLWIFFDLKENKTITRCSSINQNQLKYLDSYIVNKTVNYTDLEIKCREDQLVYCSNVVLDEENIEDCSTLGISFEKDKFCCRWNYKDSTNNYKINDYCASINEYEYLTIDSYIRYKNDAPNQRYDELTIDFKGKFIKKYEIFYLLLLMMI